MIPRRVPFCYVLRLRKTTYANSTALLLAITGPLGNGFFNVLSGKMEQWMVHISPLCVCQKYTVI